LDSFSTFIHIQLKSVVINVSGDNLGNKSYRTVTFLVFPMKKKIVWKHQQRFLIFRDNLSIVIVLFI